ncbi:hypothetical protein H632_c1169p0, partial [Helicosporidium sp. ATCC 50920]
MESSEQMAKAHAAHQRAFVGALTWYQERVLPNLQNTPPHPACPGISSRGCGGTLVCASKDAASGANTWRCSAPGCQFVERAPAPRSQPQLQILVRPSGSGVLEESEARFRASHLEISAAPGAESAVRHCGGVQAVLLAAGLSTAELHRLGAQAGQVQGIKSKAAREGAG